MMFWSRLRARKMMKMLPIVRGKYVYDVPMAKYTWFGVGGPAEVMYFPEDEDDLCVFMKTRPHNLPLFVLGAGSNLLVRDGGVPGVVIKLENKNFKQLEIGDNTLTLGAGYRNKDLRKILIEKGIGGLEFLCSIPGLIGGSVKTNAGCFGNEVKNVIVGATIIDGSGLRKEIGVDDLMLSYRSSFFPEDWIITSITFKTYADTAENITKKLDEQKEYRMKNQPYNEKTAGSTFKNPEGLKAWELIKNAGCGELKVKGAKVSEKHCNFLINYNNAKAADIEELGETIIKKVKEKTSITLEWEVKRLGVNK